MNFQDFPFAFPPMLAAILILVIEIWQKRQKKPFSAIDLLVLASAGWLAALAFEIGSDTLAAKVFWNKLQNIGVITVPFAWYLGSQTFLITGQRNNLWRNFVVGFFSIALLMIATNDLHGLIWINYRMDIDNTFSELIFDTGIAYWPVIITSYSLVVFSLMPFFKTALSTRNLFGKQAILLIITALLPIIGSFFDIFDIKIIPTLELVPIAIAIGIILNISLEKQLQVGDIVPVVRKTIIENIHDSIIVLDSEDCILGHNPAVTKDILQQDDNLIGRDIAGTWNQIFDIPWAMVKKHLAAPLHVTTTSSEARSRTYEVSSKPIQLQPKHIRGSIVILHDITPSIEYEQSIKAALEEKERLLQDIHHYIRNNLQIVSSLVGLLSHQINEQGLQSIYQESQNRIQAMALIHDKLYQTRSLVDIDFGEYIKELGDLLVSGHRIGEEQTQLSVESDEIIVDLDTGISCGLILNELISNSLKHAFPEGTTGEIQITARENPPGRLCLSVSDNGVGLPEGFELNSSQSLGLKLVETLSKQLNGVIKIDQRGGTTFTLECPIS